MKSNVARFLSRLGLPLISLCVAVILWFYAVGEQSVEVTIKVPLQVNPPAGRMTVLSSSLRDITLRLSVPRNILSVLSHQSVKAYHEIQGIEKAGRYNFRIEPRDIILPPGNIRILSIYPEVVTVILDELMVQKLPIRVSLNGEPAEGYVVDRERMQVNPDAALIEGPRGKLAGLEAVYTDTLDIDGRIRSVRRKVRLALDSDLSSVTRDLAIDVFVPVRREYSVNVFHDVPVKILGRPESLPRVSVQPLAVSFALRGPKPLLDKLTNANLLVFVDTSVLAKGEFDIPVQLKLPGEITINHTPPVVKVKVE